MSQEKVPQPTGGRRRERKHERPNILWEQTDPQKVHNFIAIVTSEGALVSFGTTRNGRSLVTYVKSGDRYLSTYTEHAEDLEDDLLDLLEDLGLDLEEL